MRGVIRQIGADWLSFLFPQYCELCGSNHDINGYVCKKCTQTWERIEAPFCACCGKPFADAWADDALCLDCRDKKRAVDFARSVWKNEGEARRLLHEFKFQRKLYWRDTFVDGLIEVLTLLPEFQSQKGWVVIPIPSDLRSFRRRGFNQAQLLAKPIAKHLGLGLMQPLKRLSSSREQKELSRQARWKHAKESYALKSTYRGSSCLQGASVLLIDDVMTTGATFEACASLLKKHMGVSRVLALSIVRGVSFT